MVLSFTNISDASIGIFIILCGFQANESVSWEPPNRCLCFLLRETDHHKAQSACSRILYFFAILAVSTIGSNAHKTVVQRVIFIKNGRYHFAKSDFMFFSRSIKSILPFLSLFMILTFSLQIHIMFADFIIE
jgi:hypothetical protein